ncbi:MAG: phosphoribosylamine--glycine ligase [Gammaproteobacteria bacterium]|nr:MAG: phosphoribosylamine--glycine ligase [Gammaproteobacteria bacterium]
MKVLVIGGGGREHALAWKAAQSERVERVFVAPGNAGTAREPGVENVAIDAGDIDGLLEFALGQALDLTIVGPEAPLVAGVVDRFKERGLAIFGPDAGAAQLEGSKSFTKDFLVRHDIATADYRSFTAATAAKTYIASRKPPLVVKADGLAAGKGVIIAHSLEQATAAVDQMLGEDRFGVAGHRIVVEDFLEGEEVSFIAIVGGGDILPLATSQDHKARDDGDRGPNTGGMGAYSPAPVVDDAMHERIMTEIIVPTVRGMADEGHPYTGFLYAGLMIGGDGVPRVLEYNCRGGDPETQPILLRMRSDLVAACAAALDGSLGDIHAEWDPRVALGVVMTAGGYPEAYDEGDVIRGLDQEPTGTKVFHAGSAQSDGDVVTAGGRVLCVCALGATTSEAQSAAYERVRGITWRNAYCRSDIGYRAIARGK